VLQGASEEAEIAERARHIKVIDVIPPPFNTILQKLAFNRFFTTLRTLVFRPSLIKRLNVRYFSRPLEFLATCLSLNAFALAVIHSPMENESPWSRAVLDWGKQYLWLIGPIIIFIALDAIFPTKLLHRLLRKGNAPPLNIKTKFKYYCFITGWVSLLGLMDLVGRYIIVRFYSADPWSEDVIYTTTFYLIVTFISYSEQIRLTHVLFDLDWRKTLWLYSAAMLILTTVIYYLTRWR